MKRCIRGVFLLLCIFTSHPRMIATLSSSSEYYGEYPPADYQPEHSSIFQEASSNNVALLVRIRYWSHEREDVYDLLPKTPLREKSEGTK